MVTQQLAQGSVRARYDMQSTDIPALPINWLSIFFENDALMHGIFAALVQQISDR